MLLCVRCCYASAQELDSWQPGGWTEFVPRVLGNCSSRSVVGNIGFAKIIPDADWVFVNARLSENHREWFCAGKQSVVCGRQTAVQSTFKPIACLLHMLSFVLMKVPLKFHKLGNQWTVGCS